MRIESRNSNEFVSKQWNSNVRQHLSLNYADVINWGRVERERQKEKRKREMCAVRAWIVRRATIHNRKARKSRREEWERAERQNRGMITVQRSHESRKRYHQRRNATKEQSRHPREYIGEQSRQRMAGNEKERFFNTSSTIVRGPMDWEEDRSIYLCRNDAVRPL